LRHVVRRASPAVAERVSAHVAVTGRGEPRARRESRAFVFTPPRCEPAVASRRVPSAEHDDVDDRACDHDDHSSADHDDGATTADHDDDGSTTTAAHDNDDSTTTARADEQRGW